MMLAIIAASLRSVARPSSPVGALEAASKQDVLDSTHTRIAASCPWSGELQQSTAVQVSEMQRRYARREAESNAAFDSEALMQLSPSPDASSENQLVAKVADDSLREATAVSYTHLTLPTILLV